MEALFQGQPALEIYVNRDVSNRLSVVDVFPMQILVEFSAAFDVIEGRVWVCMLFGWYCVLY